MMSQQWQIQYTPATCPLAFDSFLSEASTGASEHDENEIAAPALTSLSRSTHQFSVNFGSDASYYDDDDEDDFMLASRSVEEQHMRLPTSRSFIETSQEFMR